MRVYGKTKNSSTLPVIGIAAGAFLIFRGIQALDGKGWIFIAVGILLIIIGVYKTVTAITPEGVDNVSVLFGLKKHNWWKWEEISFLFADFKKSSPDVLLVVRKGSAVRKAIVEPKDVQKIFDWASEKNERMTIQYNGSMEFSVKNRTTMSKDEYEAAKEQVNSRPANFHEFAQEAKKIKAQKEREMRLRKPDMKKVKTVKPQKKLKSWK